MAQFHDSGLQKKKLMLSITLLIILFCLGLTSGIFAQEAIKASETKNQLNAQDYISKNPGSALTKYYMDDPSDKIAKQAIRYAMIIESADFSAYDEAKKDVLQIELMKCMASINTINKMVAEGMTMKRAKEKYYLQHNSIKPSVDEPEVKASAVPAQ